MIMLWVGVSALVASVLTFFSGFGLGTILLPVFALYFPIEIAIAATAVVHLVNNLTKLVLTIRQAHWQTVVRFGVPAVAAAFLGAMVLTWLPSNSVKPLVGFLIMLFGILEVMPRFQSWQFVSAHLPWGGVLSGFFGGLSGHQGALRSAFLISAGLSKEQFIATGVVVAVAVDVIRLTTYAWQMGGLAWLWPQHHQLGGLVLTGCVAAIAGAVLGQRLLKKATLPLLQVWVGVLLVLLGAALMLGWV